MVFKTEKLKENKYFLIEKKDYVKKCLSSKLTQNEKFFFFYYSYVHTRLGSKLTQNENFLKRIRTSSLRGCRVSCHKKMELINAYVSE
jgi:hypothetical protein